MSQAHGRLARIHAGAEQVELELEAERRCGRTRRHRALHAEAALLDADARLAVLAAGAVETDLGRPECIVPVRVETAADVLDVIGLGEAIKLKAAAGILSHGRGTGEQRGRHGGGQQTLRIQNYAGFHTNSPVVDRRTHTRYRNPTIATRVTPANASNVCSESG